MDLCVGFCVCKRYLCRRSSSETSFFLSVGHSCMNIHMYLYTHTRSLLCVNIKSFVYMGENACNSCCVCRCVCSGTSIICACVHQVYTCQMCACAYVYVCVCVCLCLCVCVC